VAREVVEVAAGGHDVDEAEQRGLELRVRGGQVHRLVVDGSQGIADLGQRLGQAPAHRVQLALERLVADHGGEVTLTAWRGIRRC
jgi:hypothetical protein